MRRVLLLPLALATFSAMPAHAQFFWQAPDVTGASLTPGEPDIGIVLPGATIAEERANWAWQMRAGLNVAALQCRFDPTLLITDSYNGVLQNHKTELAAAYETIRKYFVRMNKKPRAAQGALDVYGTRTYSSFSVVRSQYGFCETAARIAKRADFAARGSFTLFAIERLRELRNSIAPGGEQYFRFPRPSIQVAYPVIENKKCWDSKGYYKTSCGLVYG